MKTITFIIVSCFIAVTLLRTGSLPAALVVPRTLDIDFRPFGAISDYSVVGFSVPEGGLTLAVLGLALVSLAGVMSYQSRVAA